VSEIRDILDAVLLEDVLDREGVDYKLGHGSSGEQLNIHECPFCGGSSWKVYANRDSGLGNCFHGSCGETFNTFSFTEALTTKTRRDTFLYLERLAKEMGWRPKKRVETQTEVEANKDWKLPDSFPLPTADGQNLGYLRNRRVDDKVSAYFHLRYCDDGWFNYTKPDGEHGGMNFANRVLIPIYDLDGTMVTFQGRDLSGESDRKYLFPPGLPGTGRFLYNGQNATHKASLILCEGAFDVIRTWVNVRETDYKDHGVVGSFGIHLSKGQDGNDQKNKFLRLKSWGLRNIIMFWDSEDAAYEKALIAAGDLKRMGFKVKIARPPKGKDPGDLSALETTAALDAAVTLTPINLLKLRVG